MFSDTKALSIINNECKSLYVNNGQINLPYVSIRKIVENSLKIIVNIEHPTLNVEKAQPFFLLQCIRNSNKFNNDIYNFLSKYKDIGNLDAHDDVESRADLKFESAQNELYLYLEWLFKSFLKQKLPTVLISWHEKKYSKKIQATKEIPTVNNNQDIKIVENSTDKKQPLDEKEPVRYLHGQIEFVGENLEENPENTITKNPKHLRLLKPLKNDLNLDFFMIKKLNKWINIYNTGIIITKDMGRIFIDFKTKRINERTISLPRGGHLDYKEIIQKFLGNNLPYKDEQNSTVLKFTLKEVYNPRRHVMIFEFKGEHAIHRFYASMEYLDEEQINNIYLFFTYLAAYICEIDVIKLEKNKFWTFDDNRPKDFRRTLNIRVSDFIK